MGRKVREGWKRKGERLKARGNCEKCGYWKKVETSKTENFQVEAGYERKCHIRKAPDRCGGPFDIFEG